MAALTNALRVVASGSPTSGSWWPGSGAAGTAIVTADAGSRHHGSSWLRPRRRRVEGRGPGARRSRQSSPPTPTRAVPGTLQEVSAAPTCSWGFAPRTCWIPCGHATMAPEAIVFALANPDPEVDPVDADNHAAVVASGRSDYPNQINNVLAFPGVFRGPARRGATDITVEMLLARRERDRRRRRDDEDQPQLTSSPACSTPRCPRPSPRRSGPGWGRVASVSTLGSSLGDFSARDIDGQDVDLSSYDGQVVLVVNIASQCGFTPQYDGLEALLTEHRRRGFVVLGFPCDQFGNQEPGSEAEIAQFCEIVNFGVTLSALHQGARQRPRRPSAVSVAARRRR